MTRPVKILWRLFFFGLISVILLFVMANYGVFGKMPSLEDLENPEADLASEIVSADGVPMGKYYAENRSEVKYDAISTNVINALIATEDERFYEHSGIDAIAVGRAVSKLGTDGGGSPITQQLAKMILRQGRGNIFARGLDKIKEWIIAVKLERNFTKEEIITLYLNRAPWVNVYGIRNASLTYFQKEPSRLKVEEAALLVGMLKGSSIYNPVSSPERALGRRNTVLNRMVVTKQHYLTVDEAEVLKAKPLVINYRKIDEEVGIAPYYRRSLAEEIKKWCAVHTNPRTNQPYDLYRDGLKIYTTIDSKMQEIAEKATLEHLPVLQKKLDASLRGKDAKIWKGRESTLSRAVRSSERWKAMKEAEVPEEEILRSFEVPVKMKVFSWSGDKDHGKDTVLTPMDSIKYQKKILQTSFVCIDPKSGEVKAYVGGPDYNWFKYDNASALRQVGSTIKPLLYTLAVTDAGYGPETQISGGPLTLNGKTISGPGGPMAVCLAKSLNSAAWHLVAIIGARRLKEFAQTCGVTAEISAFPSLALGAAEIPMLQMLQAYTMFPNKGYNTPIIYMTRIEDKNGNLIFEFPLAQGKQVIAERDAYTMVKMMQGVIQIGTGRRVNAYNIPVEKAGKTGTTNDNTDGWFIGYTPELLAGSWVGCADPFIPIYGNNAGGAEMSSPRWGRFMEEVYANKKLNYGTQKEFDIPLEMKLDPISADPEYLIRIDKDAGLGDGYDDGNSGSSADDYFGGDGSDGTDGFGTDTSVDMGGYDKPAPPKGTDKNPKTPATDKGTAPAIDKKQEDKSKVMPKAPVTKPVEKKKKNQPKPDEYDYKRK